MRCGLVLVVVALASATADGAYAQSPGGPSLWRPWHPVVSVGVGWSGSEDLGDVTAESRTPALGTLTPSPFPLFTTSSTRDAAPRAELGIAVPLTSTLLFEVNGSAARPTLTTTIERDAEGAPTAEASERLDEYTVGARLLYELPRWTLARRARPYVTAGGAYLRQLHAEQVLVETGQEWSAGLGLRLWLLSGRRSSVGVTAEGGWRWRSGGIAFVDGARGTPAASLRLFAGF